MRSGDEYLCTRENRPITACAENNSFFSLVASASAGLLLRSSVIEITGNSRQTTHASVMRTATRLKRRGPELHLKTKKAKAPVVITSQTRLSNSSKRKQA